MSLPGALAVPHDLHPHPNRLHDLILADASDKASEPLLGSTNMISAQALGTAIEVELLLAGMTRAELAKAVGISYDASTPRRRAR